jgi:hypothetical protein
MARARIKMDHAGMRELLTSAAMADHMHEVAEPVEAAAKRDPNPEYAESVRLTDHVSSGRSARASARVGAHPAFGMAVEAKRGTLARALGEA